MKTLMEQNLVDEMVALYLRDRRVVTVPAMPMKPILMYNKGLSARMASASITDLGRRKTSYQNSRFGVSGA